MRQPMHGVERELPIGRVGTVHADRRAGLVPVGAQHVGVRQDDDAAAAEADGKALRPAIDAFELEELGGIRGSANGACAEGDDRIGALRCGGDRMGSKPCASAQSASSLNLPGAKPSWAVV